VERRRSTNIGLGGEYGTDRFAGPANLRRILFKRHVTVLGWGGGPGWRCVEGALGKRWSLNADHVGVGEARTGCLCDGY